MLASNYSGIETDIFLEYNSKDGTPKRTRDHYKHQFRNAYLGSVLLLDYGFLDVIKKSIDDSKDVIDFFRNSFNNLNPDLRINKINKFLKTLYDSGVSKYKIDILSEGIKPIELTDKSKIIYSFLSELVKKYPYSPHKPIELMDFEDLILFKILDTTFAFDRDMKLMTIEQNLDNKKWSVVHHG